MLVSLNVKLFIFYKVNNSTNIKSLVKVKVTQSCLTLCDPMNFSLPGSSVHGILQARTLEWVPFPGGSSQLRDRTQVSCIAGEFFTIWTSYSGNCYISENQVCRVFFSCFSSLFKSENCLPRGKNVFRQLKFHGSSSHIHGEKIVNY